MKKVLQEDNRIEYHTNLLLKEIPFKYIIKGIPVDMSVEVEIELQEKRLEVMKVTRMINRDKAPMQAFSCPKLKKTKIYSKFVISET